ncbi:coenzyme F420 hydrogenase [Thermoplasmatales archaeon SM1-50]|nr:MAG: coenzyme F420 hydrogenase [Thermoplasmatales archaeon SM1-50]
MVNEKQLRDEVKKLVSRDDVKYVIGYEQGTYGFQVTPSFAFTPEEAERFIFSPLCANNLSVYLMLEEKPPLRKGEKEDTRKVGLVVKGCDARAVVQILQEKGLKRESLVIIGVPCTGVIDPKKITVKFPHQIKPVDVREEGNHYVLTINGKNQKIPKDELLFEKCKQCEYPTPVIHDVLLGDEVKSTKKEEYKEIKTLEKKALKEKWEFWSKAFDRCIRCYACRNVCPLCYCKECIVDQLSPQWIYRSVNRSENTVWNLIRAYHLAGRCSGCGECERACPMNIPLTMLNKKIEKDIKELFQYVAGVNLEEKPLLAMFKPNDTEDTIL